jgi:hypothetical protein
MTKSENDFALQSFRNSYFVSFPNSRSVALELRRTVLEPYFVAIVAIAISFEAC